jgi:hypothetical protein
LRTGVVRPRGERRATCERWRAVRVATRLAAQSVTTHRLRHPSGKPRASCRIEPRANSRREQSAGAVAVAAGPAPVDRAGAGGAGCPSPAPSPGPVGTAGIERPARSTGRGARRRRRRRAHEGDGVSSNGTGRSRRRRSLRPSSKAGVQGQREGKRHDASRRTTRRPAESQSVPSQQSPRRRIMMRSSRSKWISGIGAVVLIGGLVLANYGSGCLMPAGAAGNNPPPNPFKQILN